MLPCLSCCPLSDPLLSCLSCMHLSIVGLAVLFFFSPVCPHLTFFSLCAPLSFSSHVPLQSFFCNFLGRLHHSCCPSNVFISDTMIFSYPSLSPDTSISASSSHLLLVVLLVLSLLPRSLHHRPITELV